MKYAESSIELAKSIASGRIDNFRLITTVWSQAPMIIGMDIKKETAKILSNTLSASVWLQIV